MKTQTLLVLLLLVFGGALSAQVTPACGPVNFTFTVAGSSVAVSNRFTSSGGSLGCIAWRVIYWTNASAATSVQIEGASDANNSATGAYTPLTPSQSTVNPALGTNQGTIVACCDYYPWWRITANTLTSSGPGTVLNVRIYGYAGTTAAVNSSGPPSGSAGGALAGAYPNPTLADITALGDTVAGGVAGLHTRVPGNTSTAQKFYSEVGDGVNSGLPSWQPAPVSGTLTYYLQNSILASGTYTSGGSITGTVGQTCTLTAFNGGGSGATATVALTGSNVIAGGTAIVVTAAGTQYTSAPTSATLGNGTATCSGSPTLATVLNVPVSNVSGYFPMLAAPYSPKTTMTFTPAAGSHVLANWVTSTSVPNLAFIPAGVYTFHIHANSTSVFTSAVLFCEFWEVSAVGADIAKIGTSESSAVLTSSELEYTLQFADGNIYTLASAASRIVARVWATTAGSATVNLFLGGTADSHVSLPSNTVDATNFVPYTGAVQNLNLGAFGVTAGAGVVVSGSSTLNPACTDCLSAGATALPATSTGQHLTAVGFGALGSNTTAFSNSGFGYLALNQNLGGQANTAVGTQALLNSTSGSFNVAVGVNAGNQNVTGGQNTAIGYGAGPASGALTDTIAVGANAQASASGHAVIGDNSITDVYLGSESPTAVIHAAGGSANKVVCWKSDGITLGYATVAEITAGTCH